MKNAESVWPPVLDNLKTKVEDGGNLILAISPFIKKDALTSLLETFSPSSAKIIVRWRMDDLVAGVSDLEIYDLLKEKGIPLYIHPKIHLKLFQFSSGRAYSGSSNVTGKGLSLNNSYNEEMGVLFDLDLESYTNIRRLCDESRLVTPEVVEAYKLALSQSESKPPVIAEVKLPPEERKEFLISQLPATDSPESFLESVSRYVVDSQATPEFLHDLGSLHISEDALRSDSIESIVLDAFREQAFINQIVEKIRSEPDMNFGGLTRFVHTIAEDVPLPVRSVIKDSIKRLYRWLMYCFDDISVFTPGDKSEVIKSSLSTAGPHQRGERRARRRRTKRRR